MSLCGGAVRFQRRQITCPVCGIENSWVVTGIASSMPYWGDITTCTNCGDVWSDGELMPRPFLRGWRQKSVDTATRNWESGCECGPTYDKDFMLKPCEHQGNQ